MKVFIKVKKKGEREGGSGRIDEDSGEGAISRFISNNNAR